MNLQRNFFLFIFFSFLIDLKHEKVEFFDVFQNKNWSDDKKILHKIPLSEYKNRLITVGISLFFLIKKFAAKDEREGKAQTGVLKTKG